MLFRFKQEYQKRTADVDLLFFSIQLFFASPLVSSRVLYVVSDGISSGPSPRDSSRSRLRRVVNAADAVRILRPVVCPTDPTRHPIFEVAALLVIEPLHRLAVASSHSRRPRTVDHRASSARVASSVSICCFSSRRTSLELYVALVVSRGLPWPPACSAMRLPVLLPCITPPTAPPPSCRGPCGLSHVQGLGAQRLHTIATLAMQRSRRPQATPHLRHTSDQLVDPTLRHPACATARQHLAAWGAMPDRDALLTDGLRWRQTLRRRGRVWPHVQASVGPAIQIFRWGCRFAPGRRRCRRRR